MNRPPAESLLNETVLDSLPKKRPRKVRISSKAKEEIAFTHR